MDSHFCMGLTALMVLRITYCLYIKRMPVTLNITATNWTKGIHSFLEGMETTYLLLRSLGCLFSKIVFLPAQETRFGTLGNV
jgi:hypothetical protein